MARHWRFIVFTIWVCPEIGGLPSGYVKIAIEAMAIEIVDFPMKKGGSFHSYVKLPEARGYNILEARTSVFGGSYKK